VLGLLIVTVIEVLKHRCFQTGKTRRLPDMGTIPDKAKNLKFYLYILLIEVAPSVNFLANRR